MSNPNPSPATRFKPGESGSNHYCGGAVRSRFIRRILRETDPAGLPARERIVRHLIELATSYTVVVAGRNLELASGRDSVEAAKLLLAYDLGTPPKMERTIPAIEVDPKASLLDVAMQIYRSRLSAGEMTESELTEMVRVLLAAEKDKALIFLKALGSKLEKLQSQQVERLLAVYEKDPAGFLGFAAAKVPEPDVMEVQPVPPLQDLAPTVAREAEIASAAEETAGDGESPKGMPPSPKDRDTAIHGSITSGSCASDEEDE